jgi:hypothetical protein
VEVPHADNHAPFLYLGVSMSTSLKWDRQREVLDAWRSTRWR